MQDVSGDPRTPVTLLTGWLGAGKTTLLNRLLHAPGGKRYAVLVNEFGEIGIDHRLVVNADEDLVELSNGCVCCTVRGDLVHALARLQKRRWKGLLKRRTSFDRVLLETTGIAEPAPLLRTFLIEPEIATLYRISSVVTLVDARNAPAALAERAAAEQIALADLLVLNKTDLADEDTLVQREAELRERNPVAPIERTTLASLDPGEVIRDRPFDGARLDDPRGASSAGGDGDAHEHVHSLGSVTLRDERLLDPLQVELWLRACVRLCGPKLVRYKGFLRLRDVPGRAVLQGTYDLFSVEAEGPWGEQEPRTELVFIGHDLDAAFLQRGLEACVVAE